MERVYVFLIRNDVWIYILCALGLLWFLTEFIRGQSALRRAMFRLERETALHTRNTALFFIVLLGSIAGIVAYVNLEIRPTLPPELLRPPTPTPGPQASPVPTPTESVTEAPPSPTSPVMAPTVTLPGDEATPGEEASPDGDVVTGTVEAPATTPGAEPTPATTGGCTPDAIITEPRARATVLGVLSLFGSANTSDFGHYVIEISGPQTNDRWASLLGRRITQPVNNGILAGNVNLSEWTPGAYEIRLSVFNEEGDVTNRCSVEVILNTTDQDEQE